MDASDWKNFRDNMRLHRLKKNISTAAMGKAVGHTPGWVSCVESGAYTRWPKTQDMLNIAKCLGVTIKEMIKPIPAGTVLYVSPEEQDVGVENLEKIRKKKGCSQRKFSEFLDMTADHYSKVLHGRTNFSAKAWMKISDQLQIPLEQLLGRDAE